MLQHQKIEIFISFTFHLIIKNRLFLLDFMDFLCSSGCSLVNAGSLVAALSLTEGYVYGILNF